MSTSLTTFECRVKIPGENRKTPFKLFHFTCRTAEQAAKRARKYGRCIGVHKVDVSMAFSNIENLALEPSVYELGHQDPIAMSDMIWKKKPRRLNKNA